MANYHNTSNNRKVTFDPGWNDPPKISYNASHTPQNRPRIFLNKRVAFPLSGVHASPVTMSRIVLPPTPAMAPLSTSPAHSLPLTATQDESAVSLNSESTLEEVKEILLHLLNNSCELGSKANDISRRIDVMEQMWADGKLNKDVQAQMKNLAYALRDDEPYKADAHHKALMVNHVSAVGAWMPGVKQLVHLSIARSELVAIDKD